MSQRTHQVLLVILSTLAPSEEAQRQNQQRRSSILWSTAPHQGVDVRTPDSEEEWHQRYRSLKEMDKGEPDPKETAGHDPPMIPISTTLWRCQRVSKKVQLALTGSQRTKKWKLLRPSEQPSLVQTLVVVLRRILGTSTKRKQQVEVAMS